MKVTIKSVLKSSYHDFQCFEDQEIAIRSGNTICIKEIGKRDCKFIPLSKQLHHLYYFKPSNDKKGVFTAEQSQTLVEIAYYNLRGERKSVNLTQYSSFFTEVDVIQLFIDEYDKSLVYGSAKNKETSCVFLCDVITKGKVLAFGYLPPFEDLKVDLNENMTLSLCGHNGNFNYRKSLRYGLNQWQIEEQLFKKMQYQHGPVICHEQLFGGRILMVTKTSMYIFQDNDPLQVIIMPEKIRIKAIVKIPRGILVLSQSQSILLYIEDNDEINYMHKGSLKIELEQDDKIYKMQVSHNNQEAIIRTVKHNVYVWKCQHLTLQMGHSDMTFARVESGCGGQKEGNISISTGKKYCLLSGHHEVTLWSIEKNQFVLSSQFTGAQRKHILACAINPDGNSFVLSFDDRIRIYRVLLSKFKLQAEFPIKKCQNIVYSNGGQLLACRYGRGPNSSIIIINLLRLVEVSVLKIQVEPIHIIWNELDDELIVSTQQNTLQVYRVAENIRSHNIKFNSTIDYVRADYRMRKILVSSQNKIFVVDGGNVIEQITPQIQHFHYVFPLFGNYFIASRTGVLYWSSTLRFETYYEYPLFTQKPFHLVCRNNYLLAYSHFDDITILHCQKNGEPSKKSSDDEIVMVERDEILAAFQKVKILQSNFDMLQAATQIKLEEQRNNYEKALIQLKDRFVKEFRFMNNNFGQISMAKLKQEKESQKIFEDLQVGQMQSVNDLEKMYERKIAAQRQRYMNLEQATLEQKLKYERIILGLESKYHNEVAQIRHLYAKSAKEESARVEEVRKNSLNDKQRVETRLLQLEEENEIALTTIQQNKDSLILQLKSKIGQLEKMYQTSEIKFKNQSDDLVRILDDSQNHKNQSEFLSKKLEETMNRVKLLESEVTKKDAMVEERNQLINEQTHQISGLEKAKYVLSFRTTEIRKELQPKEALTDKLKAQLFKLDDEFKQEKKKNFQLSQKIQKLQKINEITKKQNMDTKMSVKHKDRIHDQLCAEIFMIINTVDQKQWNSAFVKIYQSYIKEESFKSRQGKKKDDTSEQLNRHLIHLEQSLQQACFGNDKAIKVKQKDAQRKMKENSELIYQLNVMRKKEKQFLREKNEMATEYEKLKRELNDTYKSSNRNSTRAHTAKTGLTKRVIASRDVFSREKSSLLDILDHQASKEKQLKMKNQEKSRISSAHKTLMFRDEKRQQSNKFFQIAKELQSCRNTIKIQDHMIEQLNNRLFGGEANQK